MIDASNPKTGSLLLLGASVRAAAHSARRAGLVPVGVDLFADRDLVASGAAYRVAHGDYPHGLARMAAALPESPWLYTGALENHPDLIDQIAQQRPLWGNRGDVVRAVRDPFAVAELLRRAGLPHPAVRASANALPRAGSWLIKPLASAGGSGIVPLQAGHETIGRPCYYQERIEGVPLGAAFLGTSGDATLLGVTWQWVGRPGAPFGYCGSIGPWPLGDMERVRIAQLGTVLASHFGLIGLFGVDLILQQGWPWPVEVNPRYTASVEVLELGLGRSLLAEHRAVFDASGHPGQASAGRKTEPAPGIVVGKVILFAQAPLVFSLDLRLRSFDDPFEVPSLADLPQPGTPFQAGEPVMTIFAAAPDVPTCRARLERALAHWSARLHACTISQAPLPA